MSNRFKPIFTTYKPVMRCIYCRTPHAKEAPLGKEHIVPLSLNGTHILPRASCTPCSKITHDFETTCARTMFGKLRIALNAPSRRPHLRPETLPVHFKLGAYRHTVDVVSKDYPLIAFGLPEYDMPLRLTEEASAEFYKVRWRTYHGLKRNAPALTYSAGLEIPVHIDPVAFNKLLAKIAHGFAVAEFGLDAFDWLLPPYILGTATDIFSVLGGTAPLSLETFTNRPTYRPRFTHRFTIGILDSLRTGRKYLSVTIRPIIDCAPQYHVLAAEVPKETTTKDLEAISDAASARRYS